MAKSVRICGVGCTAVGRLGKSATKLAAEALDLALSDAGMSRSHLDALFTVPSLSNPHFMEAHYLATHMGLLPSRKLTVRTLDTGGAGPISALTEASAFIDYDRAEIIGIVASDAVLSLTGEEFRIRADSAVHGSALPSPCIPHGYDKIAQWAIQQGSVTRRQLAMVPVLMSAFAAKHPGAMCTKPYTLHEVLNSPLVAPVTTLKECARRADGAAALIVCSSKYFKKNFSKPLIQCPVVISTGEGSGPLYPPPTLAEITDEMFSCERAGSFAYRSAHVSVRDIEYFSLYDCFPICLMRALEAVHLCGPGKSGQYIEDIFHYCVIGSDPDHGAIDPDKLIEVFPINTHGGLQCFGAPWEAPAMFGVVEAVRQLTGTAEGAAAKSKITGGKPRRALVYGNGGIFSASSVAILGDGVY